MRQVVGRCKASKAEQDNWHRGASYGAQLMQLRIPAKRW